LTDTTNPFRGRAAAVAQNLEAEARAAALTDIGRASVVLFVLAAIAIAVAAFQWYGGGSPAGLIDGIVALGSAVALRTYHSRFLALAILLTPLATLVLFALSVGMGQGLAQKTGLLALVAAFFAVRGTFRLAAVERSRLVWKAVTLNVIAWAVYEMLTFVVAFLAISIFSPQWFGDEHLEMLGIFVYLLFLGIATLVCLQYLPFTRRETNIVDLPS
jgi:hypothetical protein